MEKELGIPIGYLCDSSNQGLSFSFSFKSNAKNLRNLNKFFATKKPNLRPSLGDKRGNRLIQNAPIGKDNLYLIHLNNIRE